MSTRKQDGTILDSPSRTQVIELFPSAASCIAADSHPGFLRENNEDSFGAAMDSASGCALIFVADGIGGNAGGALASQFTTKGLLAHWNHCVAGRTPGADETAAFFRDTLEDSLSFSGRKNRDFADCFSLPDSGILNNRKIRKSAVLYRNPAPQ